MPIPGFQTFMLPMLRMAEDGEVHTLASAIHRMAEEFGITDQEQKQLLPSGGQSILKNRVGWAKTYLKKAGLLDDVSRGHFRITDRGKAVLAEAPDGINTRFLTRFAEVQEFIGATPTGTDHPAVAQPADLDLESETPEEVLEASYQQLREELAAELVERIKRCRPEFFEKLVVDLLLAMGYGGSRADAGQAVGQSGDGGIDGIIKEDRLGLDAIYVQAKRWEGTVGRPMVQAFAGSLEGHRARKGVCITTSQFSAEARDYVRMIEKRIVLIDGAELGHLMVEHGVGVTEVARYVVKKLDADYFEAE